MGPPTFLTPAAKFLVPIFAQLCTGREQIGRRGGGRPWLKPPTEQKLLFMS